MSLKRKASDFIMKPFQKNDCPNWIKFLSEVFPGVDLKELQILFGHELNKELSNGKKNHADTGI